MRIAKDGSWFYRGSPIRRPALVKLFSQLLRRDGEEYYLVTPPEKLRIDVEDAPFVAVDVEAESEEGQQALRFVTQVGDEVVAGSDHPIRMEPGPRPYVHIRDRLWALISRPAYYRLAEFSEREPIPAGEAGERPASHPAEPTFRYSVRSRGQHFILALEEEDAT